MRVGILEPHHSFCSDLRPDFSLPASEDLQRLARIREKLSISSSAAWLSRP